MTTQTENRTDGKVVQPLKDALPYGVEFKGHITVARAAAIASVKQSTINYWLREGTVQGFRLESDEREGSEKDRSAFLLVDRKSLQAWLDGAPQREAEKAQAKKEREEREAQLKEIQEQEKALKEKRALLSAKKGK